MIWQNKATEGARGVTAVRLRGSAADVLFVHCPECLWGIRLLCRGIEAPSRP
jgi:hypothetical protein